MTTSRFYLCAIPQIAWEQPDNPYGIDIAQFAADALGCERRIAKEVNLESEFPRYTLTCQRLEQAVLGSRHLKRVRNAADFHSVLQSGYLPVRVLPADYLALLSRAQTQARWERLGASFFPPYTINSHRHAFALWASQNGLNDTPVVAQRKAFYEWAEDAKCGVVELQTSFHSLDDQAHESTIERYGSASMDEEEGTFVTVPDFETTGIAVEFFGKKGRKQHLARILRQQIREALTAGEPITFGNQAPHDVIAQVLHEFVFVLPEASLRPAELRVAYVDGSEAKPFPVFCLPHSEPPDGAEEVATPLRVALMSMRHLELDPQIDFCWFRNREVSRTRTLAETDQFCFNTTLTQLKDGLALGNLSIHMYQTGFEPAVVGFYRGVVSTLLELRKRQSGPKLSVVPFYFRGGDNYQTGSLWR